jgi:CRP-like cAMP-binding protein
MLEFTKIAQRKTYQPGETIISRDEMINHFFMISRGEVDVVLHKNTSHESVVSRLGPGEFFGEVELMRGGKSIANVRAGNKPVEVLTLPREDFSRVMKESPITAEAVAKIVQKRVEAHQVVDQRAASD